MSTTKSIFDNFPKKTEEKKAVSIFANPIFKAESKPYTGPKPLFENSKVRNRIMVSVEDLKKFSTDLESIEIAQKQILMTNADEIFLEYVLNWGSEIQKLYTQSLENFSSIATRQEISEIKNLICGIVGVLNKIVEPTNAIIKSLIKYLSQEYNTPAQYQQEIKEFCNKFDALLPSLVEIRKETAFLTKQTNDLLKGLEPYIITCSFFSEYSKDNFPQQLYISRLSSLLSTRIGLIQNIAIQNTFLMNLVDLTENVNNVIANDVPAWLTCYFSNLNNKDSPETFDIRKKQQTILEKLKKYG